MGRFLCLFCCLAFTDLAFAANNDSKSVSLEVSSSVDLVVSAEVLSDRAVTVVSRDSSTKTENAESSILVTYNGTKGVDMTVKSENDWKLKPSATDNNCEIPYYCVYEGSKVENDKIQLPASKFEQSKCTVKLSFMYDPLKYTPRAGDYSDTITISVSECRM